MTMQTDLHRFRAFSQSLVIIRNLKGVCTKLRRHDAQLTKQLRTAASSISLNLAESRGRTGKDRLHFFRIAAGSAEEVAGCLLGAEAWGHLAQADIEETIEQVQYLLNMIRRLQSA